MVFSIWALIILVVFLVVYLVAGNIFKHLIKSSRMQPGKISRIFYMDDEKFIRKWEKHRKKGKVKYVLCTFMIYAMIILVTSFVYFMVTGSDFNLPVFCGLLVGEILGLPINWNRNEEKYGRLRKRRGDSLV
jgi:L-asparagine transporter-like permease